LAVTYKTKESVLQHLVSNAIFSIDVNRWSGETGALLIALFPDLCMARFRSGAGNEKGDTDGWGVLFPYAGSQIALVRRAVVRQCRGQGTKSDFQGRSSESFMA